MNDDAGRAPVAFISHSSLDVEFCNALYDTLRARGIHPIMDTRDFLPGDDLVDRVFEKGIGASDAVIFVLSSQSVDRPWVRGELSVAVVQRLSQQTRLIPVLLGDLPDARVPKPLSSTVWIRISTPADADHVAGQIATAMHLDQRPNPPLAPAAEWTRQPVAHVYGLKPYDEIILGFICRRNLLINEVFVAMSNISTYAESQGITQDELELSLAVLQQKHYVESQRRGDMRLPLSVQPTWQGLSLFVRTAYKSEYAVLFRAVVAALLNDQARDLAGLVDLLKAPRNLLDFVLTDLESTRDIQTQRSMGGRVAVTVMLTLRRRLPD